MEDIVVILDAVGVEKATLLSVSEGGPSAIMFAATYPNRTAQIILYGTMPKVVRSDDYPWALSRSQYDRWLETMTENWGTPVSLQSFAPSRCEDQDFKDWWAKMLRQSATPGSVKSVLEALRDIDVRDVLPHVHIPALVIHRTGDRAVPVAGGRFLDQQLPNSQFIELNGQDHWWWVGDSEAVLNEIDRFMSNSSTTPTSPQPLVESLTGREMDVLRLIAAGYTNQQIADELILSLGTVKTYSSHIYGKLNVENRTQAIAAARKQGLIR
jgi:DNA-binding CsgD family transcriptional regulator/pimeloyl-ACP methyl ester carboxylesterase